MLCSCPLYGLRQSIVHVMNMVYVNIWFMLLYELYCCMVCYCTACHQGICDYLDIIWLCWIWDNIDVHKGWNPCNYVYIVDTFISIYITSYCFKCPEICAIDSILSYLSPVYNLNDIISILKSSQSSNDHSLNNQAFRRCVTLMHNYKTHYLLSEVPCFTLISACIANIDVSICCHSWIKVETQFAWVLYLVSKLMDSWIQGIFRSMYNYQNCHQYWFNTFIM